VFASTSDTQIDISWDGALLDDTGGEVQVDEIFFSHILASGTATQGSLGTWIENNNSAATPGQTVDPVWTYLDLDSLDPLTGATGEFAFVAGSDPLGVVTDLDDAGTDAAFVSTSGTGSVTAQVPVPSSFALLCAGLAGLAAFVRGGIATGRHAR
jgi:hypothetical protein